MKPRSAATATAMVGIAVAYIAWLHTPSGPLLMWLGVQCPAARATAAQIAALRERGLSVRRGTTPAPARPALGMALDRWTVDDARQWADRYGVDCTAEPRGLMFLRCRHVPSAAIDESGLPPLSELWLGFGVTGRLTAVDAYRRGMNATATAAVLRAITDRLSQRLGTSPLVTGEPRIAHLQEGSFRTARVQYRFADYLATMTASNLPWAGLSVREVYQSATSRT